MDPVRVWYVQAIAKPRRHQKAGKQSLSMPATGLKVLTLQLSRSDV